METGEQRTGVFYGFFFVTLILLFTYITAVVSLENLTYVYVALDKTNIILVNCSGWHKVREAGKGLPR